MEGPTAPGVYVTLHGHFYQPPRENPYLETIERQPSAHPDRNWNERVYRECYRPNTCARVFDPVGNIVDIVNNFEYLSFNVGPTLFSWLERHDAEVYQRILDADWRSCQRLDGHGNAIAQAYNHAILPLANARDRRTQILWGIADFRARFGRMPEGMWLPETAVDYPTLADLAAAGIKFAILAPSQAARCRPLTEARKGTWHDCGDGSGGIDSTRPYRCFLPDGGSLDLFFYDGGSARDIAFGNLLHSAEHLSARLARGIRLDRADEDQLLCVATDGETFGHHKPGGERCLAYAFTREFPARGWMATNFAHYLSLHPPTWEVEVVPETAWSCSHGLGRWQSDCGCGGAGAWRQPLRDSLDWLRDRLAIVYQTHARPLLLDPWQARDGYSEAIRSRGRARDFLARHQSHPLSPTEASQALCLLEMQRQALLMYASCGWFFEEISRPEGVQILCRAARAIDLARHFTDAGELEAEFVERLAAAPSNLARFASGADVYRQLVAPARVEPARVAIHCLMAAFLGPDTEPPVTQSYCYRIECCDYRLHHSDERSLAIARYRLASEITWECHELIVVLLHLDDWEMRASVLDWTDCSDYEALKAELLACFTAGEANITAAMTRYFGPRLWEPADLFDEDRRHILQQLGQSARASLERAYERAYRNNHRLLVAFQRHGLPVLPELELAAEIVLSGRCARGLQALERAGDRPKRRSKAMATIAAAVAEAEQLHCHLRLTEESGGRLCRLLWHALHRVLEAETLDPGALDHASRTISLAEQLRFEVGLDRARELYCEWLRTTVAPQTAGERRAAEPLLALGRLLGINVDVWLQNMSAKLVLAPQVAPTVD